MFVPILAAAFGAALIVMPSPTQAHATFDVSEATPNSNYRGALRVPHGCEGQSTHTVRIVIPEGVLNVKPMPKAGWTLETRSGPYARSYLLWGKTQAEGVREVIWSGGNLPDSQYDEFVFTARMSDALEPGPLHFPAIQECATAKASWTQIPAPGEDAHALKNPAPAVMIRAQHAAGHAGHGPSGSAAGAVKAGALMIEAPWTRATPSGAKVAGGYVTITNRGPEADRLVGGSFPLAGRFEVHEMATANGVMTMRELPKGLEIPAGGKVELKPGGFHLMFLDLRAQLQPGQPVKGTLVFEKAGTVEIEYQVAPIGARAPAGGHAH